MSVSIIICSRNRSHALASCLRSIDTARLGKTDGEVVLVDSASNDDTVGVMQEFASRARCRVQVVEVAEPGLGRARNAGVVASKGNVLAFTDDDCYLDPKYYEVVPSVLSNHAVDYCGGKVLLYDANDANIGTRLGDEVERIPPGSFVPAGLLLGANMVFRRDLLIALGGFDPEIGAGTPFRFEDIDMVARASLSGAKGAYIPELVVHHHHRRKPGVDVQEIQKKNDVARGAYYAKFIVSGHASMYLAEWRRRRLWLRKPKKTIEMWPELQRELAGAVAYVKSITTKD